MRIRLWPIEARLHSFAPYFSFIVLAFFALAAGVYSLSMYAKKEQAAMCLAENLYHEGRGEPVSAQYIIGMMTIARVTDPDPQWQKTICGAVAQNRQFSWTLDYKLATQRNEQAKWEQAKFIARDLLAHAWARYVLPAGWECARFFKRSDGKGVSKASMKEFETRLFPVGSFGHHTAYQERRGCKNPLPTN
ncbi:cell wall hydrolase [Candidatus Kaiserbacteria bacterium]|nr:cell wall hydrolase [Candidatus Kaiserbacteria bacterium]